MLALKSVLWFLIAPGSVFAFVPWWLVRWGAGRFDPGPWRWLGVGPAALGLALLLWCFVDFLRIGRGTPAPLAPPTRLVIAGLYRYVRNPMYVAIVLALAGETLLLGLWTVAAWAGVLWLTFHLFVVLYEEPHLKKVFGADYEAYLRTVPRWIPRARSD